MGRLLVMYTQIDRLIMEICAERIARRRTCVPNSAWQNRSATKAVTS